MNKGWVILGVAFIASLSVGCGSRDLGRPEAKTLLEHDQRFASVDKLHANDEALQAAIHDRIVEPRPFEGMGAMLGQGSTGSGPYRLSAKGSRAFKVLDLNEFALREPVHRSVAEITGVTDGAQPTTKVVKFKWYFAGLP